MKKLFVALTLAFSVIVLAPGQSQAYWNSPQCAGGYTWCQYMALSWCPSIHYHGPLYNYGPGYGGQGYQDMFVHNPVHGAYVPAYASTYNNYPSNIPSAQWSSINPWAQGYPGYPQGNVPTAQGYAPAQQGYPTGPTRSPTDFYSTANPASGQPIRQPSVPQPAQPAPQITSQPQMDTAVPEDAPYRTTSFRRFRNR